MTFSLLLARAITISVSLPVCVCACFLSVMGGVYRAGSTGEIDITHHRINVTIALSYRWTIAW